jgi:glycosyltransferase involved in cell wall biosynthesis
VTLVGSSYFHKYIEQPPGKRLVNERYIDGLRYLFLSNIPYRGLFGRLCNQFLYPFMAFFWAFFRGQSAQADIVVASSPPPFCIFAAKKLANKQKAALIYEVRDLWPLVVQELSGASSYNPYIGLLSFVERYAVKHADLVVSVKPGDGDYLTEKYGLTKDRFSWQPNGFLPQEQDSTATMPDGDCVTVGYVGAMSAYYGLKELLEAAALLRKHTNIRFVLVGGGEDEARLFELKQRLELNNVEFVGRVPKTEVPKYLRAFDICYVGLKDVKANYHGISCNKLFEYMHASKPIIASYKTQFDPVQEAHCGVTVEPGSPAQIVAAIRALSKDPVKRLKLGENARKYFDEHHDFSVIGEKYLETMKALVKS